MTNESHVPTEFISHLIDHGIVVFPPTGIIVSGDRVSPYEFLTERLMTEPSGLDQVAKALSQMLQVEHGESVDILLAPSEMYAPLLNATAAQYLLQSGKEVSIAYQDTATSRAPDLPDFSGMPSGMTTFEGKRAVIIDGSITSGKTLGRTIINAMVHDANVVGCALVFDHRELGEFGNVAKHELQCEFGIPASSLLTIHTLIEYLEALNRSGDPTYQGKPEEICVYRERYFGI